MAGRQRILRIGSVAVAAAALGGSVPASWADDFDENEIPFDDAEVFFELNNTDGDLGIHARIDGEAWKSLTIEDPHERRILMIRPIRRLAQQGLTELFFESAEPTFDELDPEDFFRRFPEGVYEVEGVTLEGEELESEPEVTHLLPAPPQGIMVSGTEIDPEEVDCDEGPVPDVVEPIVISWEPVTRSHPDLGRTNEAIEVEQYQVVVEHEEEPPLLYSVEVSPDVTEVEVPSDLVDVDQQLKFEILTREESGNQTAVESCFLIVAP